MPVVRVIQPDIGCGRGGGGMPVVRIIQPDKV